MSPLPPSSLLIGEHHPHPSGGSVYTSAKKSRLLRQWKYDEQMQAQQQLQQLQLGPPANASGTTSTTTQGHSSPMVRRHTRHQSLPLDPTYSFAPPTTNTQTTHDPSVDLDAVHALRDPSCHTNDDDESGISYTPSHQSHISNASQSITPSVDYINNHPTATRRQRNNVNAPTATAATTTNNNNQRIKANDSYDNASVISGLSADETHCDDGKSYRSNKSKGEPSSNNNIIRNNRPKGHHVRHGTQGRDFGDAFDHLLYAPPESSSDMYYYYKNSPPPTSRKQYQHHSHVKPHRKKKYSSSSSSNHHRSQSDSVALHMRHHPSSSSPNKYLLKKKPLPAHATLREQLASSTTPSATKSSSSNIPIPQLLQSRSTSNTVQSLSSTSSSCAADAFRIYAVQQHMTNPTGSNNNTTIPTTTTNGLRSVPSHGSGLSHPSSMEQSEDGTTSSHSVYHDLLGTRPRRKLHTPLSASSSVSSSNNNNTKHNPYNEHEECDKSLQDVPEDDPSTNWNDGRSVEGARSVLSSANGSAKSRRSRTSSSTPRSKKKVKDEMKFILKKLIPAKLYMRHTNVTLERSEGCLT